VAELCGRGGRARPALKFRRPTAGGWPSPSTPRPAPRGRWPRPPSGDSPTCCFLPRHSSPLEKPLCRTTAGAPLQRCHPLRPLPVPPFPTSPPPTHSNSKNGAAEEKTTQLNQMSRILNHSSMLFCCCQLVFFCLVLESIRLPFSSSSLPSLIYCWRSCTFTLPNR